MTTGCLGRRLDALEQIANDLKRREMRELILSLPDAHDLTPAELDAATEEGLRYIVEVAELRRQGLSVQEIVRREADRIAAKLGQTAEEVLVGAGVDWEAYR
jgi:hypothetical protein